MGIEVGITIMSCDRCGKEFDIAFSTLEAAEVALKYSDWIEDEELGIFCSEECRDSERYDYDNKLGGYKYRK